MPDLNEPSHSTESAIPFRRKLGRYRKRRKGSRRRFKLIVRVNSRLYLTVHEAAVAKNRTMSSIVEEALWRFLGQLSMYEGAKVFERLRHAQALIDEVIALAHKVPLQAEKSPTNIHEKEARQRRRNEISEKSTAAFDEIYDLCQSERLASEAEMRAVMYGLLARLAAANEALLEGASEEEVLVEIQKMREERQRFEKHTRELEARSQAGSGAT